MCLLWVIPMRDLLPLLKRHPQLYHKACSQVVPKVLMDYLTIDPLEVSSLSHLLHSLSAALHDHILSALHAPLMRKAKSTKIGGSSTPCSSMQVSFVDSFALWLPRC